VAALVDFPGQQFAQLQFARFTKCMQPCHTYQSLAWVEFELDMTHLSSLPQVPAQLALALLSLVTQVHRGALQMN
jgi:hypothetical protein